MKIVVLWVLILSMGHSKDIWIIAHKNFPTQHLSAKMIRAIYLDKKRYVGGQNVLPINYGFDDAVRGCFEKSILKKSRHSLETYWRRAHYKGRQPPKVVKTPEMLFEYVKSVETAIGYIDEKLPGDSDFKVLYQGRCR